MSQPTESTAWRKAIPESRDILQARVLVWIAVPVLCYLTFWMMEYILAVGYRGRVYLWSALPMSIFFALAAWRMKAATPLAAGCGGVICLLITVLSGRPDGGSPFHSGLAPLTLLFVLTFETTRLGRGKKAIAGLAEDSAGRNAAQIIANLGVAAVFSAEYHWMFRRPPHGWQGPYILAATDIPMLAALVEATADTVSSEIGQAFGGKPFLITTFRRVPPGTDGAISTAGTLAGITAAALIAACGAPALGMAPEECGVAFAAAVAGLFLDSLLGATLERRGWIGNDLVNLLSTGFAALASLLHGWSFA
jgi:uncharacterized protein (TIGR00297 family)